MKSRKQRIVEAKQVEAKQTGVKFVVGGLLTIILSLSVLLLITNTNIVGAASGWKDSIINKANMDIAITGQETVDELLAQEIKNTSEDDIQKFIDEQEALLEQLLREYYDAKLNGLSNGVDISSLKKQIDNIRANLLIEYKRQIDEEFAKVQ